MKGGGWPRLSPLPPSRGTAAQKLLEGMVFPLRTDRPPVCPDAAAVGAEPQAPETISRPPALPRARRRGPAQVRVAVSESQVRRSVSSITRFHGPLRRPGARSALEEPGPARAALAPHTEEEQAEQRQGQAQRRAVEGLPSSAQLCPAPDGWPWARRHACLRNGRTANAARQVGGDGSPAQGHACSAQWAPLCPWGGGGGCRGVHRAQEAASCSHTFPLAGSPSSRCKGGSSGGHGAAVDGGGS